MNREAPGMDLRDPPPGGLARLRAALAEPDQAGLWVERGVVALATALLLAVLPDLLLPAAGSSAAFPGLELSTPEIAWQALPSSDPQVRLYVAMPVAATPASR